MQANHHSAFSLFENNQNAEKFKFTIVKLEERNITERVYYINSFTYSKGKLELNILNIWEAKKDVFFISGN